MQILRLQLFEFLNICAIFISIWETEMEIFNLLIQEDDCGRKRAWIIELICKLKGGRLEYLSAWPLFEWKQLQREVPMGNIWLSMWCWNERTEWYEVILYWDTIIRFFPTAFPLELNQRIIYNGKGCKKGDESRF